MLLQVKIEIKLIEIEKREARWLGCMIRMRTYFLFRSKLRIIRVFSALYAVFAHNAWKIRRMKEPKANA